MNLAKSENQQGKKAKALLNSDKCKKNTKW